LHEQLMKVQLELATLEPRLPDDDADNLRRPWQEATKLIDAALESPLFQTGADITHKKAPEVRS